MQKWELCFLVSEVNHMPVVCACHICPCHYLHITGLGWKAMDILLKSVRAWETSPSYTAIACDWGIGGFAMPQIE